MQVRAARHSRNYFSYGHPRGAWWEIDWFLRGRLILHPQRRSQRPYRPPTKMGWCEHLQSFGLVCSVDYPGSGLCIPEATSSGEPDAGNLHVRFDEWRGAAKVPSYSAKFDNTRFSPLVCDEAKNARERALVPDVDLAAGQVVRCKGSQFVSGRPRPPVLRFGKPSSAFADSRPPPGSAPYKCRTPA